MNTFIFGLLTCLIFCTEFAVHAQNVHGIFRVVKGDVQVKSSQTGQTGRARLGQQVFPKDVIKTGADSRAKIVMVDNNEINVSPESQIEIQHYEFDPEQGKKNVLLNVIYGKVRSKVEQHYDGKTSRFQVKTPSAVAGVRGTDFVASYDRSTGTSSIVTFQGKVEFGLPGPGGSIAQAVAVTPGKTAMATSGAAPSAPTEVPKAQLAKMDNESRSEPAPAAAPASGSKNGPAPASDKPAASSAPAPGAANTPAAPAPPPVADSSSNDSSAPTSSRAPANLPPPPPSAPSPTMVGPADLVGGTGNSQPAPPPVGTGFNNLPPPPPIAPPPSTVCATCSQLLQKPKTNLTIQVR